MGSKFFGIEKREKKKKEVNTEETYDANFFTDGRGYDPSAQTVVPEEEETTTFAYAAPHGFDPSKIGAPDEKNYIPNEVEEDSAPSGFDPSRIGAPDEKNYIPNEVEETQEENENYEQVENMYQDEAGDTANQEQQTQEGSNKVVEKFNPFVAAGETNEEPEFANPVYEEEAKPKEATEISVNPVSVFKLLIGSIIKPITTVPKTAKGIDDAVEAVKALCFTTVIILILSLVVSIVTSGFVKVYDINTGVYSTSMNFGNMANIKFLDIIIGTLSFSLLFTLIVSFVYFITSFFRSKGVTIGSYIVLSNFALFPLYLGVFVLYPIFSIVSYYLGFFAFLISLVFSIISLYNGIINIMEFKSEDKKMFYNLFNIGIVILLLILIVGFFFQNDFNSIVNMINEI